MQCSRLYQRSLLYTKHGTQTFFLLTLCFPNLHFVGAVFPGVPSKQREQRFESSADISEDLDVLQIPSAQNYCAVDAVAQPKSLFQVTCAMTHVENAKGLMQACQASIFDRFCHAIKIDAYNSGRDITSSPNHLIS